MYVYITMETYTPTLHFDVFEKGWRPRRMTNEHLVFDWFDLIWCIWEAIGLGHGKALVVKLNVIMFGWEGGREGLHEQECQPFP